MDGHQADAAIYYAKACREARIFTSLDGGGVRVNTHDLLGFIDVAVVSERFCEQLLKQKGCRIGGVTMGERGLLWYDEVGKVAIMPALAVPPADIVDTNGAGDVFHGAYIYSYLSRPDEPWDAHFRFARAASAHAIRYLGNEARLPTVADVLQIEKSYRPAEALSA